MGLLLMWPRWELSQHFLGLHPVLIHKNIHFSSQWFNKKQNVPRWLCCRQKGTIPTTHVTVLVQHQRISGLMGFETKFKWVWMLLRKLRGNSAWTPADNTEKKMCRNNSPFAGVSITRSTPSASLVLVITWVFLRQKRNIPGNALTLPSCIWLQHTTKLSIPQFYRDAEYVVINQKESLILHMRIQLLYTSKESRVCSEWHGRVILLLSMSY